MNLDLDSDSGVIRFGLIRLGLGSSKFDSVVIRFGLWMSRFDSVVIRFGFIRFGLG